MPKPKLKFFAEVLGLAPFGLRMQQAKIALFGEEDVPPSNFGLSSLKQLHPRVSPYLWMGKAYLKDTVIISNLYNHTPTPVAEGWSVKKTQVKDFRGRTLSYNSHNAIDFSIPIGTIVCTAAPGIVIKVHSEFNRGGLKIHIDHGKGLCTSYVHLARSLVKAGDMVQRGQSIALSGYSGLDGATTFPFGIPHIHFNTWLNGLPVEAFPYNGLPSLWRNGEIPAPFDKKNTVETFQASIYNVAAVNYAISQCKTKSSRDRMNAIPDLALRAAELLVEMNYYPTRFSAYHNIYQEVYERTGILDLPFRTEDFKHCVFLDDI